MTAIYRRSNHDYWLTAWLFICTMIYKIALEFGYVLIYLGMPPNGNIIYNIPFLKYAIGTIWCIVFFASIRHRIRCASSFFLYMIYALQMIPITVVYAMEDKDSVFYFSLCVGFQLCIFLVNHVIDPDIYIESETVSKFMTPCFILLTAALMTHIFMRNGLPKSMFLSFWDVYELRASHWFQIGKYFGYLMDYSHAVFIPVCITLFILRKKYFYTAICIGLMVLFYLYSGHKIIFFGGMLVPICVLWSTRKNFYHEAFIVLCCVLSLSVAIQIFSSNGSIVYNLITGRCLFIPAHLKFDYYDFFCRNPHIGLAGIFPRWLVPVKDNYPDISIPNLIGAIYYNAPMMHANTGFLAEGFSRFGHLGTLLELVIFAFILKQMDYFQNRTNYSIAIGFFVYSVYGLTDGGFLSSLFFGSWMWVAFILMFYHIHYGDIIGMKNKKFTSPLGS